MTTDPLRPAPGRTTILPLLALLTFSVAGLRPPPARAQMTPQVESALDEAFADIEPDAPGCAAGIVEAGRLVRARGYGTANLDYGIPNTPHSNFYLGSVGKQFTAAAIVHAANAGHLSLDDPIQTWFPEIPEYARPVTVEHLIHHTSGLRDYLGLLSLSGENSGNVLSKERILKLIARQKDTNFPPGDRYLYSNTGYFLLAEIVARATEMSLRDYLETHFFGPLGMDRTVVYDNRVEIMPDRVVGYDDDDGDGWRMDHAWNFEQIGSGGVWSSLEDLAHWDRNYYTEEVGGPGFTEQLLERYTLTDGTDIPYAFGLTHGNYRGLPTVSHGGALAGFRSELLRFPEQRTTFLALCNFADSNPGQRTRAMADAVFGELLEPLPEEAEAGTAEDAPELSVAQLEAFVGGWRSEAGTEVEIVREEDGLYFIQAGGRQPMTVHSANELSLVGGGIRMTASAMVDGEWTKMTVQQGDLTFTATRIGVEVATPDLSPWVGSYYSDELDIVYRIFLENGVLRLRVGDVSTWPTIRSGDDALRVPPGTLEAVRENGEITALVLDAGRVQGIRFERTDDGN